METATESARLRSFVGLAAVITVGVALVWASAAGLLTQEQASEDATGAYQLGSFPGGQYVARALPPNADGVVCEEQMWTSTMTGVTAPQTTVVCPTN